MRAIDIKRVRVQLTAAWLEAAEKRAGELEKKYATRNSQPRASDPNAWHEEMHKEVKRSQKVWQDDGLRATLSAVSHGKCWYCEARITERADNPVDHFRPKNRVAEDKEHPGYWWLACDWRNYRYACTFCNSARLTAETAGGKQDRFPLWDERSRVREPGPLSGEQPLLLDPTNAADIPLLTFDRSGKPAARYSKEANEYLHGRATESIAAYHLDRGALVNERQMIMTKMEAELFAAEDFARQLKGANPTAESGYRRAWETLATYIREDAEFSGTARVFLSMKRATSQIANSLLETV
jgi:hypothetical protein